jgi:hypothetical protein
VGLVAPVVAPAKGRRGRSLAIAFGELAEDSSDLGLFVLRLLIAPAEALLFKV